MPAISRLFIGYGGAVIGCASIFLAVLGSRNVPRALTYLGKISYGLYVFHAAVMLACLRLTAVLKLVPGSVLNLIVVDGVALLLCIFLAHLSYAYLEMPFLRLKQRFEVVRSRPV